MAGEAKIDFVGNLGADPEMKFTNNGDAVASFSVAVTPSRKTNSGDWEDGDTTWYRVSAWKKDAERVVENLHKGDRVRVVGRFSPEEYQGRDGDTRMSYSVTADMNGVTKVLKMPQMGGAKGDGDPWNNGG